MHTDQAFPPDLLESAGWVFVAVDRIDLSAFPPPYQDVALDSQVFDAALANPWWVPPEHHNVLLLLQRHRRHRASLD